MLVNNAGIVRDSQLIKYKDGNVVSKMTDEAFDKVIDVNLKGVFRCTRAVVPHMIKNGGGAIVSTSSVVGLYGNFGQTNYVGNEGGRYRNDRRPGRGSSGATRSASMRWLLDSSARRFSGPCRRRFSKT